MKELQKLTEFQSGSKADPDLPAFRVAFWTLGCRLNQYDTEGIKAAMAAQYQVSVVPWQEAADLYVLNSCTVTGKADQ